MNGYLKLSTKNDVILNEVKDPRFASAASNVRAALNANGAISPR